MNKLLLFGNTNYRNIDEQKSILLINGFNVVAICVIFFVNVIIGYKIPKLIFSTLVPLVLLLIPLFLTKKGYFNASKFLLTLVPMYSILYLSALIKQTREVNHILIYIAPKVLMYALLISPIIFFTLKDKKRLIFSFSLSLPALLFFDKAHSLVGINLNSLAYLPTNYSVFNILLFIVFSSIYIRILLLQNINIDAINTLKGKEEQLNKKTNLLTDKNLELTFNSHLFSILQITSQSNKSIKNVLKEVLMEFLSIDKLGLDGKGIIFLKNELGVLEQMAQIGAPALEQSCSIVRAGECLCGKVLVSKSDLFCNDVNHSHDIVPIGMEPHGHYVVPIKNGEEVLGIFNVYIKEDESKSEIVEKYLKATTKILARRIVSEQYLSKIEEQKSIVSIALREVTDSLNYATKLQESLLPNQNTLDSIFTQSSYIYMPKDIVSGDFYFAYKIDNYSYFGVGDCTGHGIPGAFLSAMSIETVNQTIFDMHKSTPNGMLEELRKKAKLRFSINKETKRSDAMDMALCRYDKENNELLFSGANINLLIIRNNETINFKATRNPIGNYPSESPFVVHNIKVEKGDSIYLFTDGFGDQFGFNKLKNRQVRLKRKGVEEMLLSIQHLPFEEQESKLKNSIYNWRKDIEATDDLTILNVKI